MSSQLVSQETWAAQCAADGEFALAARHWCGALRLNIGDQSIGLTLNNGSVSPGCADDLVGVLCYSGDESVWSEILRAAPARFHNDLMANITVAGGISRAGDAVAHAQYYAAVMRAVELLRPVAVTGGLRAGDVSQAGHIDAPVGRYIHLNLDGLDHRIYFEEAGQGIPVLLQHTAGCHGSQWRHLFESPEITDNFRLIAYDLPAHGKSLPPLQKHWWAEPYALKGEFLRSVPVQLTQALELDNPVFMGCSVGGLLALDLAHKHADLFQAVIAIEGALKIEGQLDQLGELWHPQVSNEYKARLMEGLMSPTSPQAYRRETSFVYACGWPPVFLGDLHYYIEEFDMTSIAHEIDTQAIGVHILSGEYDYSGTAELGQTAHELIRGSSWAQMSGVGHFPMSENPEVFLEYLRPILANVLSTRVEK